MRKPCVTPENVEEALERIRLAEGLPSTTDAILLAIREYDFFPPGYPGGYAQLRTDYREHLRAQSSQLSDLRLGLSSFIRSTYPPNYVWRRGVTNIEALMKVYGAFSSTRFSPLFDSFYSEFASSYFEAVERRDLECHLSTHVLRAVVGELQSLERGRVPMEFDASALASLHWQRLAGSPPPSHLDLIARLESGHEDAAAATLDSKQYRLPGVGGYAFFDDLSSGYDAWLARELARYRCNGPMEVAWKEAAAPVTYSTEEYPWAARVIDFEILQKGGGQRLRTGLQDFWRTTSSVYAPSRLSLRYEHDPHETSWGLEVTAIATRETMETASDHLEDWSEWIGKALYHLPRDLARVLYGRIKLPRDNGRGRKAGGLHPGARGRAGDVGS